MQIDYTIGDEIVCIKSHSKGEVKEGQVFICKGFSYFSCKCKLPVVDVGLNEHLGEMICGECKYKVHNASKILWIDAMLFRKLDALIDISELTEVLENTKPFELLKK